MDVNLLRVIEIFTDGSCLGNPGPGGWAYIIQDGEQRREGFGHCVDTTNNRMEMMAVIMALEALKKPSKVTLTTDSKYVIDGLTKWVFGWIKKGWKTADNKPVKNVDLWQRLIEAKKPHDVEIHWVRGHNGHAENERVDRLAVEAVPRS